MAFAVFRLMASSNFVGCSIGRLAAGLGVALLAKFDGEFASHSSTYAGTGTVRYTW
jgi:hypothetical protein